MTTLAIDINPGKLDNPDLDIRYNLPDYIIERYPGVVADGGYDYVGDNQILRIILEIADSALGLQMESIISDIAGYDKYSKNFFRCDSNNYKSRWGQHSCVSSWSGLTSH